MPLVAESDFKSCYMFKIGIMRIFVLRLSDSAEMI